MIQCQTVIESKMAYHDMKKESIRETIVEYESFFSQDTQNHLDIAYWLTQPVGRIQFTDKLTHSWSYFSIEKREVMQSRQ